MDEVRVAPEPVLFTRQSESAVVMRSMEEHQALEETVYPLRSRRQTGRLLDAIQHLDQGRGSESGLADP